MAFPDPQPGLVIRYAYLWRSEAERGREEGGKDRPCAVVLATKRGPEGKTTVVVAPITHSPPQDPKAAIEIPAAMTHRSVAGSPLEVDPALVRLSVGIEGVGDLIADLEQKRMLDKTLIVVSTEFGRPPDFDSLGGRGHQPQVFSVVLGCNARKGVRARAKTGEKGVATAARRGRGRCAWSPRRGRAA